MEILYRLWLVGFVGAVGAVMLLIFTGMVTEPWLGHEVSWKRRLAQAIWLGMPIAWWIALAVRTFAS